MAADCIWSAGCSFGSDSFSFFSLHCRERKERALWYDTVVKVVPLPAKSEVPRRVFFRVGIPIPTLFQESLQKDTLSSAGRDPFTDLVLSVPFTDLVGPVYGLSCGPGTGTGTGVRSV